MGPTHNYSRERELVDVDVGTVPVRSTYRYIRIYYRESSIKSVWFCRMCARYTMQFGATTTSYRVFPELKGNKSTEVHVPKDTVQGS